MTDIPHHPPQYVDQCEDVYSPYTDPVATHFRETLYKIQEEIREGMDWDRRNPRWIPPWIPNWIVPARKPAEFTQHNTGGPQMADGPKKRYIKDLSGKMVEHTQVIFRVLHERPDKPGVPDELCLILDEDTAELSTNPGMNQFISGWLPSHVVEQRPTA
jgi:hypothetical protein